mgnify:CR=1 FL=1
MGMIMEIWYCVLIKKSIYLVLTTSSKKYFRENDSRPLNSMFETLSVDSIIRINSYFHSIFQHQELSS